jgi:hypothetical protein
MWPRRQALLQGNLAFIVTIRVKKHTGKAAVCGLDKQVALTRGKMTSYGRPTGSACHPAGRFFKLQALSRLGPDVHFKFRRAALRTSTLEEENDKQYTAAD